MDVLINFIVQNISQCTRVSNHHITYYNLFCQLYLNKPEK